MTLRLLALVFYMGLLCACTKPTTCRSGLPGRTAQEERLQAVTVFSVSWGSVYSYSLPPWSLITAERVDLISDPSELALLQKRVSALRLVLPTFHPSEQLWPEARVLAVFVYSSGRVRMLTVDTNCSMLWESYHRRYEMDAALLVNLTRRFPERERRNMEAFPPCTARLAGEVPPR